MGNETPTIKEIITNTKEIYMSDSSLEILLDFERVLDSLDLYAYDNWQSGELIKGPIIEKYFVSCTFMWPYKKMPDPRGAERLLQYHCTVTYQKSKLKFPREIKSPDDFQPGTKVAKIDSTPIWIVEITLPKNLMNDIYRGSIDIEGDSLDLEELEQAYDQGVDDEMNQENDDETLAIQDEEATEEMGNENF